MLLHPRHGWHLRGARPGGPAAGEVNLNLVLAACALAMFATNLDFFALVVAKRSSCLSLTTYR